jgi:hypothetical protein
MSGTLRVRPGQRWDNLVLIVYDLHRSAKQTELEGEVISFPLGIFLR